MRWTWFLAGVVGAGVGCHNAEPSRLELWVQDSVRNLREIPDALPRGRGLERPIAGSFVKNPSRHQRVGTASG